MFDPLPRSLLGWEELDVVDPESEAAAKGVVGEGMLEDVSMVLWEVGVFLYTKLSLSA